MILLFIFLNSNEAYTASIDFKYARYYLDNDKNLRIAGSGKYYDEIILSDFQNINNIKSNNHIYVFKFKNELFNEFIPFNLKIKNKSK